jgi:hypothetical protein
MQLQIKPLLLEPKLHQRKQQDRELLDKHMSIERAGKIVI